MDPGSGAYREDGDETLDRGSAPYREDGDETLDPAHGQRANELRVARIGWQLHQVHTGKTGEMHWIPDLNTRGRRSEKHTRIIIL
jgi:hypothetical protein